MPHSVDGGIVKTLVIVATFSVGVLATSVHATDLSIKGNVIETLSGSDNYFLENKPPLPVLPDKQTRPEISIFWRRP